MHLKNLHLLPILACALIVGACASIGRPEGGPIDENPPVFVRSTPMPGELRSTATNIAIYFDENVQLEDAFSKVVISPVQIESPQVSANGRRVSISLRDSLKPNTTYTIDFGDAIKDLNEGNVLDGFALDFSTGDAIDTLRISGLVLEAETLEPAQGMLVAAYSNLSDTAIRTLPPDRIARTNQRGQFTIRNLAPGQYRIYALNDLNRDWHWDRSEDVAFLDTTITPWTEPITVTDTLYSSTGEDSLITRAGIRYMPNDLLLTWFNVGYKAQYLQDYARPERRRATITLAAPPDSTPVITMVGTHLDGTTADRWALTQRSAKGDSITLWLADTAIVNTDSLRLAVRFRKPDSLDVLQWSTDTLKFTYREPKRSKKDIEADTLPPRFDLLQITAKSGSIVDVDRPLTFAVSQPLAVLDTAAMHLEMQVDTLWQPVALPPIRPDSIDPLLLRHFDLRWEPGAKYRFTVDSAAFVNIYGEHNPPFKQDFTIKSLEDYTTITFVLTGADSTAVVELLNSSGAPVRRVAAVNGRALFQYLTPGTYYARMFFDTNGDGLWTTGILDSIQPEEVAYYPKKLDLKRNWEIEQPWDIYDTPLDAQKPYAILKNRPKLRRGEQAPVEEEEEEEDDFFGPANQRPGTSTNRTTAPAGFRRAN